MSRENRYDVNVEANLKEYLSPLADPTHRYASFDYCFNYFQDAHEAALDLRSMPHMELACLQLGFYLASWGMLRGSTVLLHKSVLYLEPVVAAAAAAPSEAWSLDTHQYTDDLIELALSTGDDIRNALQGHATDTLVTKIMLGVFGSVPAFDSYFQRGFGVRRFNRAALKDIRRFYDAFATTIDEARLPTTAFATGEHTTRLYSRAKVIDMIFFIEGSK